MNKTFKDIERVTITGRDDERQKARAYCDKHYFEIRYDNPKRLSGHRVDPSRFKIIAEREVIIDETEALRAENARLRAVVAAADKHIENSDYPCENGNQCLYCGVDLPKDLPADHKPTCDWQLSLDAYYEAYTRAREAVG